MMDSTELHALLLQCLNRCGTEPTSEEYLYAVRLLRDAKINNEYELLQTLFEDGPFSHKDVHLQRYNVHVECGLAVDVMVRGRGGVGASFKLRPLLTMMAAAYPEPGEPDVLAPK